MVIESKETVKKNEKRRILSNLYIYRYVFQGQLFEDFDNWLYHIISSKICKYEQHEIVVLLQYEFIDISYVDIFLKDLRYDQFFELLKWRDRR